MRFSGGSCQLRKAKLARREITGVKLKYRTGPWESWPKCPIYKIQRDEIIELVSVITVISVLSQQDPSCERMGSEGVKGMIQPSRRKAARIWVKCQVPGFGVIYNTSGNCRTKETMKENANQHRECTDMVVMQVYSPLPAKSRAKT